MILDPRGYAREHQEKIFKFYLGEISEKLICSPFRDDKNPTCGFWYSPAGRLYLHDFATDEYFDSIEIVKRKYNCSFYKALQQIVCDAPKFEDNDDKVSITKHKKLEWVYKPLEHDYYKRYNISQKTLLRYQVAQASAVYLNESLHWRNSSKNPIFIYKFLSGRFKAYRPLSPKKDAKWIGTAMIEDIFGWEQLPSKGQCVIITSSAKDVMGLYELGFNAIAFASEGIPTKGVNAIFVRQIVEQLKERFEHVMLLLNNDTPGKTFAEKASKEYSLVNLEIPTLWPKDPSDCILEKGTNKTKRMLKKIIKNNYGRKPKGEAQLPADIPF